MQLNNVETTKAHIIVPHFSSRHFQLILLYFHTALMPVSCHNQSLQKIKSKDKEFFQLQVENANSPRSENLDMYINQVN